MGVSYRVVRAHAYAYIATSKAARQGWVDLINRVHARLGSCKARACNPTTSCTQVQKDVGRACTYQIMFRDQVFIVKCSFDVAQLVSRFIRKK